MEMFLYRRAALVVPVTEGFRRDIVGRGIPASKVETITNGVDTMLFRPGADREEAKRKRGLAGRFVVLYLGAHGISHALGRILEVAARFEDDPRVLFLFVGDGAEKPGLVAAAAERGLGNVRFLDPVPKAEVPGWYAAADVGLVPLRDVALFRTFIPSKMFEIMGTGTPVVGSVTGEAAEILTRSGGALVTGPEDVEGIAGALRRLVGDDALRERLGREGRAFVEREYDRGALAERYATLLSAVVSGRRG
jgi:glycosyltransferase involved in cell wall biosynthesis